MVDMKIDSSSYVILFEIADFLIPNIIVLLQTVMNIWHLSLSNIQPCGNTCANSNGVHDPIWVRNGND